MKVCQKWSKYLKNQGKPHMTVYLESYIDFPTLHSLYVYSFVRRLIRGFLEGWIDRHKANPSNKGIGKDGTNKYKARNTLSLPWVDFLGHFLPQLKTFQSWQTKAVWLHGFGVKAKGVEASTRCPPAKQALACIKTSSLTSITIIKIGRVRIYDKNTIPSE